MDYTKRVIISENAGATVCLTADLIASRQIIDRAKAQKTVETTLAVTNEEHAATILVPFSVTLGDEWQGLVANVATALRIDFEIRRALYPLRLASGIGVGTVATPLKGRTVEMDGECFHRSRAALEQAKRRKGSSAFILSSAQDFDDPANTILSLLHALSDRWTKKQHATFVAFRRHGTEATAAEALRVSQPTVHKSLVGAMAKHYSEAQDALIAFATRVGTTIE